MLGYQSLVSHHDLTVAQSIDFIRIGAPMQILLWILSVLFIVIEPSKWYMSWIFTIAAYIVVSLVLSMGSSISKLFSGCKLSNK